MDFFSPYSTAWLLGLATALLATGLVAGVLAGLLGVGGGITADSDPEAEWQECLDKAAPIVGPVAAQDFASPEPRRPYPPGRERSTAS